MRAFLAAAGLSLALGGGGAAAGEAVTLTDVAGRAVTLDLPVDTVILGEGRFLPTLAILDGAAVVDRVAGMMGDFERFDPMGYAQYEVRLPAIADIPRFGHGSAESFSIEKAVTLAPDVAIFGLGSGHGPGARHEETIARLEAAGIPVVVIDFRIDPLTNTPKSMELLGRLFGKEARAAAFLDLYRREMARVERGVSGVTERPSVFMELHVGLRERCCMAMGREMMGRFIDQAGGRNLVGAKIPGTHGEISLEYLLVEQPDVYIGTAIGSMKTVEEFPERIVLGVGADAETARASLRRAAGRTGLSELTAIRDGRMHAIWHHFYNTPFHVAAVQAMATWIHPDRFADLDPRATLATLYERFQPVPLDGVYWASLGVVEQRTE